MSTGLLRSLVVNVVANAAPMQKTFASVGSSALGLAAKIGAVTGGMFAVSSAFEGAAENDKAVARLNAVVEATGHAAGYSSQQIQQMAAELQQTTTFADDVTISAAAMLAGFQRIKGDIFREAIVAAQDMSTVMQQSLPSSIALVGKALDDPIRGLTALTRVGFVFSAAQKKMIAEMMEANNIIGAQKLILEELRSAFGGAAAAEAKTFAGAMDQLKTSIGDVGEAIAMAIQPHLLPVIEGLKTIAIEVSSGEMSAATLGWLKFGASVAAVVYIAPKVYSAINGISQTIQRMNKAVTLSNIVGQAFSGPKGWLTLLVSGGVAIGASMAVEKMLNSTSELTASVAKQTSTVRVNVAAMHERAEKTAEVERAEEKFINKLKEEIATYGMSSREAELYKAQTDKVTEAKLAEGRAYIATLTKMDAAKKTTEEFIKLQEELATKAQTVRDAMKTPVEQHQAEVKELLELVNAGALSWAEYAKAVNAANQKLIKQKNIQAVESPTAIEKGSAAAFQKIAESRGIQRAQQLQEKQLKEAEAQTRLLTQIATGNDMSGTQSLVVVNF